MELADTDEGILYLLQCDARHQTTEEMAAQVGVSASTIRDRIGWLEDVGIIRGYYPDVDYDRAGLQYQTEIICRAPDPECEQLANEARGVSGVIAVRELFDGQKNVHVDAIGTDSDSVTRITDELNDLGLTVTETKIVEDTYTQPFDHFGRHVAEKSGRGTERPDPEDPVSYEPETDTYRTTFDNATIDPSIAIVETIASVSEQEATELDPLYDVIDLTALDQLLSTPMDEYGTGNKTVVFTFQDYSVTVTSRGRIEVQPMATEE